MIPYRQRLLLVIILSLAAGLTVYRTSLLSVISSVLHREGSSHGVFIPILSAYFIWLKKDQFKKISVNTNFFGILPAALGLIPVFANTQSYQFYFIGWIVLVNGLVFTILGKAFYRCVGFPLLFLVTMTPVTGETYNAAADLMRHITFQGSLYVIPIFGVTYFKSGWLIELPETTLEVAQSCSGIRYLVSYFIFSIAYGYLTRSSVIGRISVVIAAIPISIGASILRLSVIFLGAYYISPRMGEYWPHVILSWFVFFGVMIAAISIDQYFLNRMEKNEPFGRDEPE